MAVNVADGVDTPTIIKKPQQIWTPPQLAAFLEVAAEHRLGAFYEFALHTALRRGEVCGLRWADVDVNRAVAIIRHNRVHEGGKVIETTPKTDSSLAEIELSTAALDALEAWRLHQDLERTEWGDAWQGEGHVFTYEDGRALNPSFVSKLFSKLAKKTRLSLAEAKHQELAVQGLSEAEIEKAMPNGDELLPQLTLHGLRHVAATYMWDSTGDLLAVSKALRHSSPAVTAAVYTHMKSGKQRALFDAIAGQLQTAGVHTLHTQAASGA
ncbi:tyrosine-type recombinase/integrase [Tessaracoccus sp. Y36]